MKKLKNLFGKAAKSTRKNTFVFSASVTMMFSGVAGAQTKSPDVLPIVTKPAASSGLDDPPVPEAKPAQPRLNDGVNYWKHKDYDMVIKTWPCEEQGLCASIDSINPDDANNRMAMAQLKGYGKAVKVPNATGRGGPPATRYVPDPSQVERWEISEYCGFEPDITLKKQKDGSWKGTITSPFNGGTYGLDVKQLDNGQVKVYGYLTGFPLIKLSEKADNVAAPPPACKFSWPDP